MPFYPLRYLRRKMLSVKDEHGEEQEIDWNDPYQRVKFFYEYNSPNPGEVCHIVMTLRGRYKSLTRLQSIDALWRGNLKLVSVDVDPNNPTVGRTVFEFIVPPLLSNAGGNLHGGAVAVIFDVCTSMTCAAVSKEDFWDAGHVSRALNCQYIRPAPTGTVLLVESEVVHLGRSLGQLSGTIRRKDDGKLCYTCVHDKVQVTGKEKL
jgi:acyl-coenzyme A thioesterase 13